HQSYHPNFDHHFKDHSLHAKHLSFQYNHTPPTNLQKPNQIIHKLFAYKLHNLPISIPFHTHYPSNIKFPKNL
ncbi:maltose acetyltransferase domain-containing protein, partial [Staphylococcus capitis]|uniref:maltose acetyltransferase domain-containing protein n=1 Tax=Staphylococcus capitis TaxID=29388 RepID=UPI003709BB21